MKNVLGEHMFEKSLKTITDMKDKDPIIIREKLTGNIIRVTW